MLSRPQDASVTRSQRMLWPHQSLPPTNWRPALTKRVIVTPGSLSIAVRPCVLLDVFKHSWCLSWQIVEHSAAKMHSTWLRVATSRQSKSVGAPVGKPPLLPICLQPHWLLSRPGIWHVLLHLICSVVWQASDCIVELHCPAGGRLLCL